MNRQYGAMSGAAIVLIILNHTIHFGFQAAPVSGIARDVLTVLQMLGVFAVPTFLFISGAFVAYAARGKMAHPLKFIQHSVSRILWPYLFWSLVYYAAIFFVLDKRFSGPGYVKNLLVGFPYHFVPLIIFYYILSPLLVKIGRRRGLLLLLAVGLYQIFLIFMRNPAWLGSFTPPGWTRFLIPPVLFNTMADWAIFFPMGLVFSLRNKELRPYLLRFKWVTVGIVVVLFSLAILDNIFGLLNAPWLQHILPIAFMFVLPAINRKSIPLLKQFEKVGKRSYGVYLSHLIVLTLATGLIQTYIPGLGAYPIVVYPLFFIIALGIPMLAMERLARIAQTRKVYKYVFG